MAGEGSKVRLVRCPKCLNLLPEHPDVSVYKCGACGALLRAKKKGSATRSREGRVKWHGLVEKEDHGICTASETEMETSEIEYNRRKERAFRDKNGNLINISSPRTEDKQVKLDNSRNERDYDTGSRFYQSKADKVIGCADKSRQALKHPVDDEDRNVNRSVNFIKDKRTGESSSSIKNSMESLRSRVFVDRWGAERDVFGGSYVNHIGVSGQGNCSARANPNEGPPRIKNCEGLYGPKRVQEPKQDQAELLRKLDELKDKLSALCNVADTPKDRVPINAKLVPSDAYRGTVTHDGLANHFARGNPRYFNNGKGHAPSVNSHDMDRHRHNSYFSQHAANGNPGYEDLYRLHMLGTVPNHSSHQYPKRPGYDYLSEQHMDISRDHGSSRPHKTMYHKPGCSCSLCYNLNWQAPSQIPLVDLGRRRLHENPINSHLHHHASHFMMGTQNYSPQASHPLLHSRDQLQHPGWPGDIDSDIDGFRRMRPRKEVVASTSRQLCYPILGGAPFIMCCSCFELLKLPSKFKAKEKSRQKLRCGACSTVNVLKAKDNKLILLVPKENNHLTANADNGSNAVSGEGLLSSVGCVDTTDKNNFASDYDFHSTGVKDSVMSREQKSSDSNKGHGGTSSCSISYEKEESLDNIIVHGDVSSKVPAEDDGFSTNKHSHSAEYFNNPSPELALSRYGEGKLSKQTNQENLILNKSKSGQKFVEAVSLVTEAVSFNDDLNTSVSQESTAAASLEEDQARINKGNKSFLKGLIKMSFRDFSRADQNMKTKTVNVLINGQPIPDLAVKKAEMQAGPIQPGDYWYDSRSGFWGVMGQPCLGIIPSFIEEFEYPMPRNCANGNTSVFVNGRELHQQDLDLLAHRGLPTTRDKFYILEISGRVLDEDSGEEIASVGQLAPTVIKLKRGFGMRVPEVLV